MFVSWVVCLCGVGRVSPSLREPECLCLCGLLTRDAGLVGTLELVGRATRTRGEVDADARVARVGILATVEHTRHGQRRRNVLAAALQGEPAELLAGRNDCAGALRAGRLEQQTEELVETLVAGRFGEEAEEGQRALHLEAICVADNVGKGGRVEGQHGGAKVERSLATLAGHRGPLVVILDVLLLAHQLGFLLLADGLLAIQVVLARQQARRARFGETNESNN